MLDTTTAYRYPSDVPQKTLRMMQETAERVARLEKQVAALTTVIEKLAPTDTEMPVKRSPGRPRKTDSVEFDD